MDSVSQTSESDKWPVPFGASVDTWKMLILAFYREGADRSHIKFDTAAAKTGQSVDSLKRLSRFITFSGFMSKNEYEEYKFTENGANYAKALAEKDAEATKDSLGKILMGSPLKEIHDFIEIRQAADKFSGYEELFNKIKANARIGDDDKYYGGVNPAYKTAIDTLIDMFVVAEWVPESIKPLAAEHDKTRRESPRRGGKPKTGDVKKVRFDSIPPAGVEELKWDGVRIWLPKDDPDALKKATSLLDSYRKARSEQ